MMTVFTIGVMSLSILGGASPSETSKGKTDYEQRSRTIKQWKDTCCAYRRKGGEFRD